MTRQLKTIPNILHISPSDNQGGSARSAYKIHFGLQQLGLKSRMLVRTKITDDPDVDYIHGHRLGLRLRDFVGQQVVDHLNLQYLYYPSSFALTGHSWYQSANLIQLYNIHGGFFTYRALPKISRQKPVVWRLSDMWPFTGHCVYSYSCDRWKSGCGSCPLLNDYPALSQDTTALLWKVKEQVYRRSRLVFVATNSWMEKLVRESPLLGQFPTYRIPNGVDTEIFHPIPKPTAREALNIAPTAKVVLFAAHVAKFGTRKGGEYVPLVMEKVAASGVNNLVLVVMGVQADSWPEHPDYQTIRLGFTNSDRLLAIVYSAADVFLHPALAENFPNSILESMACGTPPVSFDTGGVADVVHHMKTGYLAGYKNTEDLGRGVKLLLEDAQVRLEMSRQCRTVAEAEYSNDLQAQRYAELYEALVALKG
ncbi:MAG: glycosyltransferase family 4 protein [Xenococcaceae cyanobacterium]